MEYLYLLKALLILCVLLLPIEIKYPNSVHATKTSNEFTSFSRAASCSSKNAKRSSKLSPLYSFCDRIEHTEHNVEISKTNIKVAV